MIFLPDADNQDANQGLNSYQILSVEMVWLLPREDKGIKEVISHIGPIYS